MELKDFLARNNSTNGIGGILLYAHGTFMQMIEGDSKTVACTYDRIAKDPRHFNIHIMLRQRIEKIRCEDWGFSHVQLGKKIDRTSELSSHFFPFKKRNIKERVPKGDVRDVLKGFIETNR